MQVPESNPLDLELQVVVRHPTEVLGIDFSSLEEQQVLLTSDPSLSN